MKVSPRGAVFGLILAFLASGCGGSAPVRAQYLLRSQAPDRSVTIQAQPRVGIARVAVAPYLDQSGLIVETESREVKPARYHHWAEPLDNGLLLFLGAETAKALGEPIGTNSADRAAWEYSVDVSVEELHGTLAGEALLVATFRITSTATSAATDYRFSRRTPLEREGYASLVDAEARLATDLARAIAAALGEQGLAAR